MKVDMSRETMSVEIEAFALPAEGNLSDNRASLTSARPAFEDDLAWLQAFRAKNERPLRVLHVGNIANNAYLNAKFLRSVGVEADVLCYDYYHVMACPEWEEVEVRHPYGSDYAPRFSRKDLKGYRRPEWFLQGPLRICAAIVSRSSRGTVGSALIARFLKRVGRRNAFLPKLVGFLIADPRYVLTAGVRPLKRKIIALVGGVDSPPMTLYHRLREWWRSLWRDHPVASAAAVVAPSSGGEQSPAENPFQEFGRLFPSRANFLADPNLAGYLGTAGYFRQIFEDYDIIQCYSIDPIYGMLARNKPFVAFEHGTLRDFTMGDNLLHCLTAMGYRKADHVFITNGDCLDYAEQLGVERYTAMIHPIDVDQHRTDFEESPAAIKARYNADLLLLCPLRHDWAVKGTDVHLRALPLIKERVQGRVVLLLTSWGQQLEESRALLSENGCADNVVWLPSLSRISLIKLMRAADVVLDQIALPHFGATAPQSLAAGTPVISSYRPESTAWIVDEPAPILPAFEPAEVADRVVQSLDSAWRKEFQQRAREWVDNHHHPNRVIRDHLKVYRKVLERNGD